MKFAVLCDLDDRITGVGQGVDHLLPVGEIATRCLGTAFEDMAGETATGEPVMIFATPAEFVNTGPERYGAVHATAGNDDIGPATQGHRQSERPPGRR